MIVLLKLAYRNLMGGKLRTWLNVLVLSFCYVLIIWHQGLFEGMLRQGTQDKIKDEIGGGQYWSRNYDPNDPIAIDDSSSIIASELKILTDSGNATPILIRQASIFPGGRIQSIFLKGIDPGQKVLNIPSSKLGVSENTIPVLIGQRMAKRNNFKPDDYITIRFRDAKGTFDAIEVKIAGIMETNVPTIDVGQVWMPLKEMQKITGLEGKATIVVAGRELTGQKSVNGWIFRDTDFLTQDITSIVKSKRSTSLILYAILLFLAVVAVFDTQILSIFRRQKEIGTLIALGMTKMKVVIIFTFEGAMNGILAVGLSALYGIPILIYFSKTGFQIPMDKTDWGVSLAMKLFPVYSFKLVMITVVIIMIAVTIVSYLPTRDIAKLNPTEALKGKVK